MPSARGWLAAVSLLGAAAAAKRACPADPIPCSPSCLPAEAKRHCRYCKCKACAMCMEHVGHAGSSSGGGGGDGGSTASRGRKGRKDNEDETPRRRSRLWSRTRRSSKDSESGRPRDGRPQLGGSRRWVPTQVDSMLWNNASLASKVLRLLGYVPGAQMPLEFGGTTRDYSLQGTRFEELARLEVEAAGPTPVSLREQRHQVAMGTRKPSDVSWQGSPVAGLLPQKAARPPTPKERAKKHKLRLFGSRKENTDDVTLSFKNLTLVLPSTIQKSEGRLKSPSRQRKRRHTKSKRSSKSQPIQTRVGKQANDTVVPRVRRSTPRGKPKRTKKKRGKVPPTATSNRAGNGVT